jgi:methyl-accepting chemotaxis protein
MLNRSTSAADLDFPSQADQAFEYLQKTVFEMEQQTATYYQLAHAATESAAKLGDAVANMASTMALISDSKQKIGDIISVIDSIAFQANIQSLRADSDTTPAEKHRHGSSVPVSEGHSLAGDSEGATKKIKVLVETSAGM